MVIREIEVPTFKIIDFIKTKKYQDYSKVYISRFEETGKPDCYNWKDVFSDDEIELLKDTDKFCSVDNTSWPTFFLFKTVDFTTRFSLKPNNPTKHFVTMNYKHHYHRCYVMDHLNMLGLLTRNYYSWLSDKSKNPDYQWKSSLNYNILQKSFRKKDCNSSYDVPDEIFEDSAFSLVLESQCNNTIGSSLDPIRFLTEKTFIPIYHNRPFLILGNWQHNLQLENFGFKKFPFIDYEFDDIKDNFLRMERFVAEVQRICQSYLPIEIAEMSRDVCEYNFRQFNYIYENKIGLPEWLPRIERY